MTKENTYDPGRYEVRKSNGFQDPRAEYVVLRVDQHTTDPVFVAAAREAIWEHLIPSIKESHPGLARGLQAHLDRCLSADFTWPENADRDHAPQPNQIWQRQGDGFYRITSLSIDQTSGAFVVHFRACEGPKNAFSFSAPLADFFEEIVADGLRQRVWQQIDEETGDVITPALVQVAPPEDTEQSQPQDEGQSTGAEDDGDDDDDTNPGTSQHEDFEQESAQQEDSAPANGYGQQQQEIDSTYGQEGYYG